MKWKIVRARTIKINRAASTPRHGLEHYCRDLNGWPRSWMGLEKDLPPGEQLVSLFRPFLGAFGNIEPDAPDDPEARRQHLGISRRVHHRTQLHAFAQKGASGESSGRHDQGRRPHSPSRRFRGTTAILRVHLPKALEIPQSITGLSAGQTTDSSDEAHMGPALHLIARLYAVEERAKALSAGQRFALRQRISARLLGKLHQYLLELQREILPKSRRARRCDKR